MHRIILTLARAMALAGGAMLVVLVLLTCASIVGRELNEVLQWDPLRLSAVGRWLLDELGVGAIDGDFEMLEAGMAFTIFAFLPLTQITQGHAVVDVFADRLPARFNRWFAVAIEAVFAAVLILIAWQLFQGMLSKATSGQTTMRLQFPVWWAYAMAVPPAALAAATGVWCAWARLVEARTGRVVLDDQGAGP